MSGALKRFGGIGVAIVIALAWFGFDTLRAKADAPEVGECVTVGGTLSDAEVDSADCDDDDVLYKVVSDDGGCDEMELNYTVEVTGTDAVDLCLFYEVEPGDCIKFTSLTSPDQKVECTDNKGDEKVVKVVSTDYESGSADCPKGSLPPMNNVEREATLCFTANR